MPQRPPMQPKHSRMPPAGEAATAAAALQLCPAEQCAHLQRLTGDAALPPASQHPVTRRSAAGADEGTGGRPGAAAAVLHSSHCSALVMHARLLMDVNMQNAAEMLLETGRA
jgi:hypothetical protein